MKTFRLTAMSCALAALTSATAQAAAVVHYQLSGLATASFKLDLNPTPSSVDLSSFSIANPPGSFPGITPPPQITFYIGNNTVGEPGGFFVSGVGPVFYGGTGPQLFTGTVEAPKMRVGTFYLDVAVPDSEGGLEVIIPHAFTLVAEIPEPASWALMIAGFGLTGGTLRSRKRGAGSV